MQRSVYVRTRTKVVPHADARGYVHDLTCEYWLKWLGSRHWLDSQTGSTRHVWVSGQTVYLLLLVPVGPSAAGLR